MVKIKLIDYGIASRIGNIVYINKELKNYPKLYNSILRHEKAHSSGFDIRDILLDINGKYLREVKKEYWKFVFRNPNSWIQFAPIASYEGKIVYDPVMIFVWISFIILIALIIIEAFLL